MPKFKAHAPWLAAIVSGILWFGSCPPFPYWPMAWIAMIPLLWAMRNASSKRVFLFGWITGIVATGGGFPWIPDLIVRFGGLPVVVAWVVFILYTLYQGLIFALIAWGTSRLQTYWPRIPLWAILPLTTVAVEFTFPLIFPWYLAITQGFVPTVIQIAEITGPVGVSALLVMFSALLYEMGTSIAQRTRPPRHLAVPTLLLVLILSWSAWRIRDVRASMQQTPKIGVAMIQPNIGIDTGHARFFAEHQIAVHQHLSSEAERLATSGELSRLDLLVWSESSYPYPMHRQQITDYEDPPGRIDFRRIQRGFSTPLLMGATTIAGEDENTTVYNSAQLLDRNGRVLGRYDKNWLLMFGEYIPFYDFMPFLHDFFRAHRMSNMTRGTQLFSLTLPEVSTSHGVQDVRFGPLICYEDILPDFGRRAAQSGPHILVNITNDAWFGASQEPWQHLSLAVFRSVETRLPMVRNVNIGVSTFIWPTGELGPTARAQDPPANPDAGMHPMRFMEHMKTQRVRPMEQPGLFCLDSWPYGCIVATNVPVMSKSATFFVRFGNVFAWLCLLIVFVGLAFHPLQQCMMYLRNQIHKGPHHG